MNPYHTYWTETGQYYGYPKCCISEYVKHFPIENKQQLEVANNGFIPCTKHAKMITERKITLPSLINNRQCQTPFS